MEAHKETGRIEAFSDAVFAIAITLLALDLKVPTPGSTGLVSQLLADWRAHLAYLAAFFTIAVMYLLHHRLFALIWRADGLLFLFNFLVLLGVVTIPFWTSVTIGYIRNPERNVAQLFHGAAFVVPTFFFNVLWWHASHHDLLDPTATPQAVRRTGRVFALALVLYIVSFFAAFASDVISTALNGAIALFFILLP